MTVKRVSKKNPTIFQLEQFDRLRDTRSTHRVRLILPCLHETSENPWDTRIARRVCDRIHSTDSSRVGRRYDAKNVASSGQERSHADVVRQADDVRPGRPSKDTKIVPDTIQQQQKEKSTPIVNTYSQYYVNSRVTIRTSTGSSMALWTRVKDWHRRVLSGVS